jgi:phosphoribosylanthranilate isomerase
VTAFKVCGICRPEDAAAAAQAGASYMGVILAPGRRRTQTAARAAEIYAAAPLRRVGVFVDAVVDEMARIARELSLDVIQLHGAESPETARTLADQGFEVWKAVAVRQPGDLSRGADRYDDAAHALLLEGWSPQGQGGVGATFDWEAAAVARRALSPTLRIVVAGGLTPDNVGRAVELLAPDVADVSSGVEDEPGVKSVARMQAFADAVRRVKGHT